MQIEIYTPTQAQPLPPVQWNYAEVKRWIEDGLAAYKGRVYTEESIATAKKDRAALNKLAEAIDAKRKEMKAMYLQPYEQFEAQAKELTAMVKAQAVEIDTQVKAYDDLRRREKQEKIREVYAAMIGNLAELVPYARLHNPKWLNVSVSMSAISEELGRSIDKIESGLASIDKLGLDPDIAEQVTGVFLRDFDLAEALSEKERIEKQRDELARYKAAQNAQEPVQEERPTVRAPKRADTDEQIHIVTFRIRVTSEQLKALGDFMRANNIRPERA